MRNLSVSDYFVEFLITNGVTDVFGYQGGMIAYIFDSLGRYSDKINYHSCGTEQGAALAACGYAQASGKLGVAISTSGPGFTNLLTGMANAWFDSLPVLFVSGNVNTKDKKRSNTFRQNGFQEIQAAQMAAPITKKSVEIELGMDFAACFDDAIATAMADRRGPVYLDLPINICREQVEIDIINPYVIPAVERTNVIPYISEIMKARKPIIIAGAGINQAECRKEFRKLIDILKIPVVTTMPAMDLLPSDSRYMMGYIGGTGRREAGIALQNADFVMSLGTRLCSKQVGHNMSLFAPKADKFVRVDVDDSEFERKLKADEVEVHANLRTFIGDSVSYLENIGYKNRNFMWADKCAEIHELLSASDMTAANQMFKSMTDMFPDQSNILLDVGKNMNYGAQSSIIKDNTKLFMSAGLGTMGYAIPAAVGAVYGNHQPTFVFVGDGGAQMNIQELNTIAKNNLPVKIFVLNNKALGNIRIFQEAYLDSRFVATEERKGDYFSCDFVAIARAYGICGIKLKDADDLENYRDCLLDDRAVLFEIEYEDCPLLPGIVAGGEYLKEGTGISSQTIARVKEVIYRC